EQDEGPAKPVLPVENQNNAAQAAITKKTAGVRKFFCSRKLRSRNVFIRSGGCLFLREKAAQDKHSF
ncbi:MAG: hypothetical protein M3Y27_29735, partial [Acidobacteriota bacterium]|nr:hypothetical protein [Acidobacteriota bacterium]